jgi:3'-phosphoadenosine 5'-phosphosulfate sulfotransferase (PAPS reductase)/FAD synthetase
MPFSLAPPFPPDEFAVIVSVSGGKDSAASAARVRHVYGLSARYVFADTGWEAPETYAYLPVIERALGITIERVGVPGGMRAKIRARAGFPARKQRWCTRELKVEILRAFHDRVAAEEDRETVSVVGIRAEESDDRALMSEWGYDDRWKGYVWRPAIDATVAEIIEQHHAVGLPLNPLYLRGHNRVGCWPCIYASKEEVRLWAENDPDRVDEVRALEREIEQLRAGRNAETPGRYAHAQGSFFQSRMAVKDPQTGKRRYLPMSVDDVVAWSKTDHGGRQGLLVREAPDSGCFRWGMCEPPEREVVTLAAVNEDD